MFPSKHGIIGERRWNNSYGATRFHFNAEIYLQNKPSVKKMNLDAYPELKLLSIFEHLLIR